MKTPKDIEQQVQREVTGRKLRDLLVRANLPKGYPQLNDKAQLAARLSVLRSWYDPTKPQILCTNTDKVLAAFFLWNEFYVKPAHINLGRYYFDDPLCKYEMVGAVMANPMIPTEPAKSIITAARRLSKTETLVIQLCPFMCITRPYTEILVSEYNATRTEEEIRKVKIQVEQNERIHADFGAKGVLFPTASGKGNTWTSRHLSFIHHPGSAILGHSLKSAQRGRGPIFGIWDDPEPDDRTFNRDWRLWLFDQLFNVYLPMFHSGGKFVWIGTPIHRSSCLSLAFRGVAVATAEQANVESSDLRFQDFRRKKFAMIFEGKDGELHSQQPERLTVAGYHRKVKISPFATASEMQCEPVTPGQRAFPVDMDAHSYMHCNDGLGKDYMLDLAMGTQKPWDTFLKELRVFGAGDPADGVSSDCDPAALVYIGIDPTGVIFVLDAFTGRVGMENLIPLAYAIADSLDCETFGWEEAAMQVVVSKMARSYIEELREEGKSPACFVGINNARKNKIKRVLTMMPLFGKKIIRFLNFDKIQEPNGTVHVSVPFEREKSYRELVAQVREFTDQGIRGPDDLIDALEMAVRISAGARGQVAKTPSRNNTQEVLDKWKRVGFTFNKTSLPREAWTEKMHKDTEPIQVSRKYLNQRIGYCLPYM